MKPTWQTDDGAVRLYLGDCLHLISQVGTVHAVVTDPPYGLDYSNAGGFCESAGWNAWKGTAAWDKERPSKETFAAILALDVPTAIWGGNYFTDYLPPSAKWLVWDKGQTDFSLADVEVAWCSWPGAMRRLMYPRALALKDGKVHPTQKPLAVMEWNLRQLPPKCGPIVADFFMGSGTTGISCLRMGRTFIGVEKDPDIFAAAVKRIEAELSRAPLFEPPPQIQRSLIA